MRCNKCGRKTTIKGEGEACGQPVYMVYCEGCDQDFYTPVGLSGDMICPNGDGGVRKIYNGTYNCPGIIVKEKHE